MTGSPAVATAEQEFLTPKEMLSLVQDWIGGCTSSPGNIDVIEILLATGVEKERLVMLAHLLVEARWSRYGGAHVIVELLGHPRVMAAVALHGHRFHGLGRLEARRDVRTLRAEAREIVQRELLASVRENPARRLGAVG